MEKETKQKLNKLHKLIDILFKRLEKTEREYEILHATLKPYFMIAHERRIGMTKLAELFVDNAEAERLQKINELHDEIEKLKGK